ARLAYRLAAGQALVAEGTRAVAPRRGRRLHRPDPRARGTRRRCLAAVADARRRSRAPSRPARCTERALRPAERPAAVPAPAVRNRLAPARRAARRHLRVGPAVTARGVPRRARP